MASVKTLKRFFEPVVQGKDAPIPSGRRRFKSDPGVIETLIREAQQRVNETHDR